MTAPRMLLIPVTTSIPDGVCRTYRVWVRVSTAPNRVGKHDLADGERAARELLARLRSGWSDEDAGPVVVDA